MARRSTASAATGGNTPATSVGPTGPHSEPSNSANWESLLSTERRSAPERPKSLHQTIKDFRTPFEKDFDRVAFSTPVRRLKDKTQVFPLEMHDGVRTRLTHSLEVSHLARSMGIGICESLPQLGALTNGIRDIPALLAAIALTHDLGNPPFGHQGEVAIRRWISDNRQAIINRSPGKIDPELLKDFLLFEGNAQGFRVLTRLQQTDHKSGLRLTAGTLRAFIKYPWGVGAVTKNGPKKFGYFASEAEIFEWCCMSTGVKANERHPLNYLMEVCDDIAYSVLDIEDAVKKELVSVHDVRAAMEGSDPNANARIKEFGLQFAHDNSWLQKQGLSHGELRDAQIELIRSYLIGVMVSDAVSFFVEHYSAGRLSKVKKGIAEEFGSKTLMTRLKAFALERVYKHPSVLRAELLGHTVIPELMGIFWRAIDATSRGTGTKADEFVFGRISENYRRVHEQAMELPSWYRDVQLVCDQVCGMTDSYAVRLHADLAELGIR